jgi:hypothetical protein
MQPKSRRAITTASIRLSRPELLRSSESRVGFVWGEAFDQPWKISIDSYEPHMGLNAINNPDGTANPKPIMNRGR